MAERAPDLAGPIVGWRVWRIAVDGELVSAYTPAGWPARRAIEAGCYERPGEHEAPSLDCVCGVYACEEPGAALFYAHRSRSAVVGRVKLWGAVVEHEAGWRAQRGYPEAIFVPREHFDVATDDVAAHLAFRYGVPVRVVDELQSVLRSLEAPPAEPGDRPMPPLPDHVVKRVQPLAPGLLRLASADEEPPSPVAEPVGQPAPASGGDGIVGRLRRGLGLGRRVGRD